MRSEKVVLKLVKIKFSLRYLLSYIRIIRNGKKKLLFCFSNSDKGDHYYHLVLQLFVFDLAFFLGQH